jgi:hypothetical protein
MFVITGNSKKDNEPRFLAVECGCPFFSFSQTMAVKFETVQEAEEFFKEVKDKSSLQLDKLKDESLCIAKIVIMPLLSL